MMGLSALYLGNKAKSSDIGFLNTFNGRNDSRKWNTVADLSVLCPIALKWEPDTAIKELYSNLQRQAMTVMGLQQHSFNYLYGNYPKLLEFGYSFIEETDEYIIDGTSAYCEYLAESGSGGLFGIYEEISLQNDEVFFIAEYRPNEYFEESIEALCEGIDKMFAKITADITIGELLS